MSTFTEEDITLFLRARPDLNTAVIKLNFQQIVSSAYEDGDQEKLALAIFETAETVEQFFEFVREAKNDDQS